MGKLLSAVAYPGPSSAILPRSFCLVPPMLNKFKLVRRVNYLIPVQCKRKGKRIVEDRLKFTFALQCAPRVEWLSRWDHHQNMIMTTSDKKMGREDRDRDYIITLLLAWSGTEDAESLAYCYNSSWWQLLTQSLLCPGTYHTCLIQTSTTTTGHDSRLVRIVLLLPRDPTTHQTRRPELVSLCGIPIVPPPSR